MHCTPSTSLDISPFLDDNSVSCQLILVGNFSSQTIPDWA